MFEFKIWILISQTINFFVLFWILNKFLFTPIGKVIEARQEEIAKMKGDTTAALDEAKRLKDECQQRLNNIKVEMDELKRQKVKETEDSVTKVIVNAKNKAETKILLQKLLGNLIRIFYWMMKFIEIFTELISAVYL